MLALDIETMIPTWKTLGPLEQEIAIAVTFDDTFYSYDFYETPTINTLEEPLNLADSLLIYNASFDLNRLAKYFPTKHLLKKTIDPFRYLLKKTGRRISLQELAKATLGKSKIYLPESTPVAFMSGKASDVAEKCKRDVDLLYEIYDFGRKTGYILYYYENNLYDQKVDW